MDTTTQQSTRPIQQPVASAPVTDTTVPSEPVAPVSTHPEQGPRAVEAPPTAPSPADVVAEPTHPEITVGPELHEVGVEHGTDAKQDKLSDEVKDAGVTLAKEAVPVIAPPQVSSAPWNYPLKPEEVTTAAHQPIKNSIRWLATKIGYFLKQSQQSIPK